MIGISAGVFLSDVLQEDGVSGDASERDGSDESPGSQVHDRHAAAPVWAIQVDARAARTGVSPGFLELSLLLVKS